MYSEHLEFESPPDDASLWKYVDFTKFVSLLERQALFFATTDTFADPFEGSYPVANVDRWSERYMDYLQDLLGDVSQRVLVDCWHENEFESAAMWKLYSGWDRGIAIKTTVGDLKESFQCPERIFIGSVRYINYETETIGMQNSLIPYMTKRRSFEHEREVRAVNVAAEATDRGVYYGVDVQRLLREVVVAPDAEDWLFELVQAVMTRYGQTAPVRRSSLAEGPRWRPSA